MAQAPRGAADRIAHLLKLVAGGPPHFTLSELAERAALPQSSVHRLLQSLLRAGLVERGIGQGYRPGRELTLMAAQLVARFDLVSTARPWLRQLVQDWHETAVLCVYSPAERIAVITDVELTSHPLRFAVDRGVEISLPWGSLGRAVLAFLPEREIAAIVRNATAGPLTGRARPPRDELEQDLALVRANRYSRYFDPAIDIAGIAAPIFRADGAILGCIGVTMPSKRYQLHLEDNLVEAVVEAAGRITEAARIAQA